MAGMIGNQQSGVWGQCLGMRRRQLQGERRAWVEGRRANRTVQSGALLAATLDHCDETPGRPSRVPYGKIGVTGK